MKSIYFLFFSLIICDAIKAQKSLLERVWYNAEKTSKIEIFKTHDGDFYGRIVWLKEPNDANGKAKLDKENKDEKLRNQSIMGLLILKRFKKTNNPNEFDDGTVYDPNNGKTYCGKITLNGKEIKLRGHICGLSWLGRSSTWILAE